MAAQQVDAQALAFAAAGGNGIVKDSVVVQNTGSKSVSKKKTTIITKKTRPKRRASKRFRQDVSISGESNLEVETGSPNLSSQPNIQIPCREGCSLVFSTLLEADAHVRQAHAGPKIDQLPIQGRSLMKSIV